MAPGAIVVIAVLGVCVAIALMKIRVTLIRAANGQRFEDQMRALRRAEDARR